MRIIAAMTFASIARRLIFAAAALVAATLLACGSSTPVGDAASAAADTPEAEFNRVQALEQGCCNATQ